MGLTADDAMTLALIGVLLIILVWYYNSLWKPYEGFPTCNFLFHLLRFCLVTSPRKNLAPAAYVFNYIHARCMQFTKEGLFFAWSFVPYVMAYSPEAMKLLTEPAAVEKARAYSVINFAFGSGLLTSKGKVWAQHRKIINPTFHRTQYKNFTAVFNRKSIQLIDELRKECKKPSVDIKALLERHIFNISLETVIGIKGDQTTVGGLSVEEFFKANSEIATFLINRLFKPWLFFDSLWTFFPGGSRIQHMLDMNYRFPEQVIKEMLDSTEESQELNPDDHDYVSTKCKPLVKSLLDAYRKDPEAFTLSDVRDELAIMIVAGYLTVTAASLWAVYLLGLHPDIQENAFGEVSSKMGEGISYEDLQDMPYLESIIKVIQGEAPGTTSLWAVYLFSLHPDIQENAFCEVSSKMGEGLSYEDLQNMPYLEGIIKETLRLYPTIPLVARTLQQDVQLSGYTVPKGTDIVFCIYSMHRNPTVFHDPERFDPDRFAQDRKNQIGRFDYIPFGEGPRMCIGKTFSMLEMKVILSHIIRNFKIISLDPRDKIHLTWNITLYPVENPRIQFVPRDPEFRIPITESRRYS